MPSIITVKVKYTDNSKSLSHEYPCGDPEPIPEIIKSCETDLLEKWNKMGGSFRDLQVHTTVKRTK